MQLALSQPELQMIPVTKGETFLGWVDTKVLLNPTHWGEDRNKPVSSIMKPSSSDIAIDLSTNIAEAIDKFSSSPTSALFVCEGERLAGVVYPRNMLQYMKENMQKKVE
jgi:predicted transcriptional regulator